MNKEEIANRISKNRKTVCVQGLGFVGSAMSVAVALARNEKDEYLYNVIGIDVPTSMGQTRIDSINKGFFPFENNDIQLSEAFERVHKEGNILATSDNSCFELADIVIIDINLDIQYDDEKNPILDLSAFKKAIYSVGTYIKEGTLVIVETTVPPGTCEKVVYPTIKERFIERGLDPLKIHIAHSYERVMPGKEYFKSIINFWRVYSGIDNVSADLCQNFLETVISTKDYPLTRLENTTASETAKVLENSYRAVNIAFMEEWGQFAEEVHIDLYKVIDAIRMRPTHSNMRQPGFGVGGYCLTKDPYFAKLAAKELFGKKGLDFPFCTLAVKTNNAMPILSLKKLEEFNGSLDGKRILLMGISYRQDVGDTRYSPSEIFAREAIAKGAIMDYHDPLVKKWDEMDVCVKEDISDYSIYDVIVFAVPHIQYREIVFEKINLKKECIILDSNRVLADEQIEYLKTHIQFISIGR